MNLKSYYVVTCLCGTKLTPHEKECVCPNCGAKIRVTWPAEAAPAVKGASA